jgi:hypothetical protein
MALKQYLIKVEGFVIITAEEPLDIKTVPMKIDVHTRYEGDEYSPVIDVIQTEITEISITSETNL